MNSFWNYYKKSYLITIIIIIISFLAIFLSKYTYVRYFKDLYDIKHPFMYILFLNYPSITYFSIWIFVNNNDNVAIKMLKITYLSGFVLYALCIILVIIDKFPILKVDVLMGIVPLGLYIILGSVFILHGINYLLYLEKWKITIILLSSYCLFFCIQHFLLMNFLGFINVFITPVFFVIWAILFVWLSVVKTRP